MKKSIILFIAAVTFFAFTVTAQADRTVDENVIQLRHGFPGDYYCNCNVPDEQGNGIFLPTEYVDRMQAIRKVVLPPQ
jgi:hypothetical protein